jgi:hypothetical protein
VVRLVGALLALAETVAGDVVDVDGGPVEGEEHVATLWRVRFEPVAAALDAATSSDAYGQNGERQVDQPNSEIGKRTRQCCSQTPSDATVEPGLRLSLVPRATYPCRKPPSASLASMG